MHYFASLIALQFVLVATFTPATLAEERVALVIGNATYAVMPPLRSPRGDAEAVAAALRTAGFQTVTLETDLGKEKFIEALRLFSQKADKADWAVIYFAGHGVEIDGVNYLIPVDARLEADRDAALEAVTLKQVLQTTEGSRTLRIVFLDASRDNPFAAVLRRRPPSTDGQLPFLKDGTLIVYATRPGETVVRGDSVSSPFAGALVKHLRTPSLEVRKLLRLLRDDVLAATGGRQQPFEYGSMPGVRDFYFTTKK